MAEDINQDEDDIEEEEEDRGAEAQQTLDDLTVLGDSSDRLDDPEERGLVMICLNGKSPQRLRVFPSFILAAALRMRSCYLI